MKSRTLVIFALAAFSATISANASPTSFGDKLKSGSVDNVLVFQTELLRCTKLEAWDAGDKHCSKSFDDCDTCCSIQIRRTECASEGAKKSFQTACAQSCANLRASSK